MTGRVVCATSIWRATLEIFKPYHDDGVEGGCYWYAATSQGSRAVSVVGVPRQLNEPRFFDVAADDLAELNTSMAPELTVVAQLHGHPGTWVGLSEWDEGMTLSRKVLSIVLPNYGPPTTRPRDCGVHAWTGTGWQQVSAESLDPWLVIEDRDEAVEVVDLR